MSGDPLAAQGLLGGADQLPALRSVLRAAGSTAPSAARGAAFLHDGAGLGVADIATVLGCPVEEVHRLVAEGRLEEAPPWRRPGPCAAVRLEGFVRVDTQALAHALTCADCGEARSALRAGRRAVLAAWEAAGAALATAVVEVRSPRPPPPAPVISPEELAEPALDPEEGCGREDVAPPAVRPSPRATRRRRERRPALALLAGLPVLALVVGGPWPSSHPSPAAATPSQDVVSVAFRTAPEDATVGDEELWERLAACQSHGDWSADTGNGYYGGLQFSIDSWQLVGGEGMPHEASPQEQIHRGRLLRQLQGWSAWPVCAARLGLVS